MTRVGKDPRGRWEVDRPYTSPLRVVGVTFGLYYFVHNTALLLAL